MKKVIIGIIVCLIIIALICSTVCLGFIVRNDKAKIAKLENEIAILKENNINHDLKDEEDSGEDSGENSEKKENAIENAAGIYERTDGNFGKLKLSNVEEDKLYFGLECYYNLEGEEVPSAETISGETTYDDGKYIYIEGDYKLSIKISGKMVIIEEEGEYPYDDHNVTFAGKYQKISDFNPDISWKNVFDFNGITLFDDWVQRHTIDASLNHFKRYLDDNMFPYANIGDCAMCFEGYGIGDTTRSYEVVSNYEQYERLDAGDNVEIRKYEDPIVIKAAFFDGNFFTSNGDAYDYSSYAKFDKIEERTKYQADVFEDVMEKGHWPNKIKLEDCYYKPTGILFMNGNNRSEEDYYNNARAKSLKLYVDGNFVTDVFLTDSFDIQLIDLEGYDLVHNDISVPVNITMEVTEYYEGKKSNDIYISDIQIGMKSNLPGGI